MELKDFEKFLKICRKLGVNEVVFGQISVKFGQLPPKKDVTADDVESDFPDNLSAEHLTPEQLMFAHIQDGL